MQTQSTGTTIGRIARAYERTLGESITLIASENVLSPEARYVLQSELNHRYVLPPENERSAGFCKYPNQGVPRQIEAYTRLLTMRTYHGRYADVRALSANNACQILLRALVKKGESILSVPRSCGGHFATDAACQTEGIRRIDIPYKLSQRSVDLASLRQVVRTEKPRLIFLDASTILYPYPLREMREIAGSGTLIAYDGSHTLGLIGGGMFQSPLEEGADLLQGSTHKSLFGPHMALMVAREVGPHTEAIHNIITPHFVSTAHLHHIAALGVALEETEAFGGMYARQVVSNACALAEALQRSGVSVLERCGVATCSPQVIVAIGSKEQALAIAVNLEAIGIRVNTTRVPFDGGFGLRIGLNEITRYGCLETSIRSIGRIIGECIFDKTPHAILRAEVAEIAQAHQEVQFWFGAMVSSAA